ncbi:zinc finger, SWIM-type containing protein [Tanacetum coccineum]|uniref:Zinc finger, SWIM-type containing protein n=1 Tax=Tanacetum coccineum TaxID=301880 RepID=A0ABQ5AME1_9ASTR
MTTSSTSSLLPANSPTTNLPPMTTTNLPPTTSMTTNLPPATSTTSHLLLATSTTSHLPPATSSTSHLLPSASTVVVRNPEDGSVECTCRHFLGYGFLCRHVFCVLKNCNIEVIPERYILRRWRRDLIPPALRRNTNRYGEKDEAIEKLTNEANFVVDECLFLLRKDKEQLKHFVEKLENIKKEIQVKVPNPPSQKKSDVIEDIYAIKKPKQNLVNIP